MTEDKLQKSKRTTEVLRGCKLMTKCEIYRDNFQNYKRYNIPKAQLVIADIPYNIGVNFYGSNPMWYNGGDNSNGESKFAKKAAFNTDFSFKIAEYFHFCNRLLKKEPKEKNSAPCMIVFCAFQQMQTVIEYGKKYGFAKYIPLVFCKNYSPQVLKANMRVVGATEHAILLYRDKLPKFRNHGKMVFDWFPWLSDGKCIPKIHPTQKPVRLMEQLIKTFTDEGDTVIDPCCGSGSTLRAAHDCGRNAYGFEIDRTFYERAKNEMLNFETDQMTLFD